MSSASASPQKSQGTQAVYPVMQAPARAFESPFTLFSAFIDEKPPSSTFAKKTLIEERSQGLFNQYLHRTLSMTRKQ